MSDQKKAIMETSEAVIKRSEEVIYKRQMTALFSALFSEMR